MKYKAYIIVSTMLLTATIFVFYLINPTINFLDNVYINEVMADNQNTIIDYDGDYSDWIEIYNANNEEINLYGYYLTDDELELTKWQFPSNSVISANSYKVIFTSGKNKIYPNNELHTNFKINDIGEKILLVAPDKKTIIDSVYINHIGPNTSYGRIEEGNSKWKLYRKSLITPYQSNKNAQNVPDLYFSHESGFYNQPFTLQLYSNGDTIYYTLDGSVPNENSTIYQEGIYLDDSIVTNKSLSRQYSNLINWYQPKDNINSAYVIRAISIKNGIKSDVVTKTYFIDKDLNDIDEEIPTVSLSTNIEYLLDEDIGLFYSDKDKRNYYKRGKAWERLGHLEFFDENKELVFSHEIAYRIHGGASRSAPNKALRIYAHSETGYFSYQFFPEKDINIFSNFILRNGGSNWRHVPFRDALLQSLIKDVSEVDIQYYLPVRLFINGEYWGLYFLRDRFDDKYLYNHYGVEEIDMISNVYTIEYGSNEDYLRLRDVLQKSNLNNEVIYEYVKEKLDVENFADYSIAQIYYMNVDQPGKNVKIWRTKEAYESEYEETDGRWRYMLYDTDMSFYYNEKGNFYSPYDRNGLIYNTGLDYFGASKINNKDTLPSFAPNRPEATFMLRRMLEFDEFRFYFINRFADLLNTAFLPDIVYNKIVDFENMIMAYMDEHIARWYLPNKEELINNLQLMKTFALNRPTYMYKHLMDFFALEGTINISVDINNDFGNIKVNSLVIDNNTIGVNDSIWNGTYFKNVPIEITANPKDNYEFKNWISNNEKINGSSEKQIKISLDNNTYIQTVFEQKEDMNIIDDEKMEINVLPHVVAFFALFSIVTGYLVINKFKYL